MSTGECYPGILHSLRVQNSPSNMSVVFSTVRRDCQPFVPPGGGTEDSVGNARLNRLRGRYMENCQCIGLGSIPTIKGTHSMGAE